MLTIEYDHDLVEQATFLAARRDERFERDLHLVIDPLYEISDKELRQQAFEAAFREFFAKFGLSSIIADLLKEVPIVGRQVGRCVVGAAPRARDESAELFVQDTETKATPSLRTLVIQVCPQSLLDSERFVARLRRELLHVADMLDDRFAYAREAVAGLPARQNLVRDRYRILWDIYVEGRLHREGRVDNGMTASLRRALASVFAGATPRHVRTAFNRVYETGKLTHSELLHWANRPEALFDESARSHAKPQKLPGEPCPLCGFPTHEWFDFGGEGAGSTANRIRLGHKHWSVKRGACRQCAEMYGNSHSASPSVGADFTPKGTNVSPGPKKHDEPGRHDITRGGAISL